MVFTTLAHHIDIDWLREAHRRTRKGGARGVDGQSANEYAANLEGNLRSLLERAKSGTYRAPPVRRVHIPKGDGKQTRPIGIPTFEDKILQRAVTMLLGAVYEQDFYDFSYGFRPGRSAHQALEVVQSSTVKMAGGWVLEVDIRKFFDTLGHEHLREILRSRVRDGVVLRLIGKWLNAGVLEGLELSYPDSGTPQGGVISPLLANIYLHEVLDEWFVREVQPRLKGRAHLVRFADDFVVVFQRVEDARRVFEVLPKRFERFGLTLHPDKTRLLDFRRPDRKTNDDDESGPRSFDLLGFTHFWGRSRRGKWVVQKKTAKDRLGRSLRRIRRWCRMHRHDPVGVQHLALSRKLCGHYAYYGVTGNFRSLERFYWEVVAGWRKWLSRRSRAAYKTWEWLKALLRRLPLPRPRIVHRYGVQLALPWQRRVRRAVT
jgi:group II intron reverse transcriptase/maturase